MNKCSNADPKIVSNLITTKTVLPFLNEDPDREINDYPVPQEQIGRLAELISEDKISYAVVKKIHHDLMTGEGTVDQIVERQGLIQVSDASAIEPIVEEVLAKNPESVASFKAGKERALGALVGQVMKASGGKANPKLVNELILKRIRD